MSLGFVPSKGVTSLFFYTNRGLTMMVLVYVDNIIVVSPSADAMTFLLQDLEKEFALKDLGGLHYFLGIEVIKTRMVYYSLKASMQQKFFSEADMMKCKPVNTSLLLSEKLSAYEGEVLGPNDATNY
jgi:hypothetical protein